MLYLIAIVVLLAGCVYQSPWICDDPPGVYQRIQEDKTAYFEGGKPVYKINTRGYGNCSVENLNEETVNREVWEDTHD